MVNDLVGSSYLPRVVDRQIERQLAAIGGIVIEGPKACGKTRTGMRHCASSIRLDAGEQQYTVARADPPFILKGDRPRFIDEWQLIPELWNLVRHAIDDAGRPGQFILAGSAVPTDDVTRHSGAGRIARLRMRPFTLFESSLSSGAISLAGLFERDAEPHAKSEPDLGEIIEAICRGGWPAGRGDIADALTFVDDYRDELARTDVSAVDGVRRDPQLVRGTMAAWSRCLSGPATLTTIARDLALDGTAPSIKTVAAYVGALERLMVIEDVPPWRTSLRSRARLRQTPKRQFVDPSIAVSALGATPDLLRRDGAVLGTLFESLVVRDLRVYLGPLGGDVFHYRDNSGLEVDAIVQLRDGRWGAVEVKLGPSETERAAAALTRFVAKVDTARMGEPQFLAVVTATGQAYRRPNDGVWQVPVSVLGP